MVLLTWETERALCNDSDWSRAEGGKGEEELNVPNMLELHLQELLSGQVLFLAGTEVGDCFPQTSMLYDPEPSPMHQADWIWWCAHQVDTPAWWRELQEVPSHDDQWEFVQRV